MVSSLGGACLGEMKTPGWGQCPQDREDSCRDVHHFIDGLQKLLLSDFPSYGQHFFKSQSSVGDNLFFHSWKTVTFLVPTASCSTERASQAPQLPIHLMGPVFFQRLAALIEFD